MNLLLLSWLGRRLRQKRVFFHGSTVFFRGMAALATGRRAAEELLTIRGAGRFLLRAVNIRQRFSTPKCVGVDSGIGLIPESCRVSCRVQTVVFLAALSLYGPYSPFFLGRFLGPAYSVRHEPDNRN